MLEDLETKIEQNKKASFPGGSIEYSVSEGEANSRPIVVVPGFTEGRIVLQDFANSLNELSRREVIVSEQPQLTQSKQPIIDHHAEALLAVISAEGLMDVPVDFIAHSLGAPILIRAAELAQERGIKAFDAEHGSHTIFIAPAGSNQDENILKLGGRFAKFMAKPPYYGKELDPTGEFMKAGTINFFDQPKKTAKEIVALSKKEKLYKELARVGLRPFIFSYANDDMYPYKTIETTIGSNEDMLSGWATPIDTGGTGAAGFDEFKSKSGLSGDEAKRAWVHHYRNAGHNDLIFHPERTAKAVLQVLQG